ncbi:unnamed protein product [Rotaria socialis]|uniref:Fibronectin type-III domain-containing protein n=1 Tax=Rotaria socialis TaxID=392032 RepID=A0A818BKS4_9BILA|nr:unnamed protein product [Rotaria socialis]
MILFILQILFFQIIYSRTQDTSNIRYDPLLSAQCKARCLYEYRNHSQQQQQQHHRSLPSMLTNEKTKRLLTTNVLRLPWRSIWERCPRLITCSSCLLPCDLDPPLLLSDKQSCQAICSTLKLVECEQSCIFIQNLYQQHANCLTGNCQLCSSPYDCSRKIPQPYNVTAIERKSRRTVRLKWNSYPIINTEPIFYVIEAQWTFPKTNINQYELVSKWGFVKEEVSNAKAIIRNIQRDNRWYKFRVAAVTRYGHSPFSITTKLFRLTNESYTISTIIDPPRNFSIKDYQFNSNTMNITLVWQKPNLSVHEYQISWKSENDQSSLVNSVDISSSLSSLEFTIPFLSIDNSYLFKIRSMITSDGNHIQMSLPILIHFNSDEEFFPIKNFQISKPYFINGLIKANISWSKNNDSRIKQYDIYWIENKCHSDVYSCCYRRDAVTIQNHFQLYDLRFNCTYLVNINAVGLKVKKSFRFYFNISSCELTEVYGSIRPPCQTDRKTIDIFSSLPPLDLIVRRNGSGFNLRWQNIQSIVNNAFYRLRIEQLPNHVEIASIEFPIMITNYFIPYSKDVDDRYLNVTLSLIENMSVRQQQSILINDKKEEYFYSHVNMNSSSIIIHFRYFALFIWFVLVMIIK